MEEYYFLSSSSGKDLMARTKQTARVPPHLRKQHLATLGSMSQWMESKQRELALLGPRPVKHAEPVVVTDSEAEDAVKLANAENLDAVRTKKRKRDEDKKERKGHVVIELE